MPSSLNTVHISTARTWRGGENQLWLLARGLIQRGHKALVVAPRGAPLLERCREASIPVQELNARAGGGFLGSWRLAKLLRRLRPQILHAHDGHAVMPCKLSARLAGNSGGSLKLVAHRRTVFKIKGRTKYTGRVDAVIAISNAAREELLRVKVPAEKIHVVYSGMDFPEPLARDSADAIAFRNNCVVPDKAFVIAHAAALTSEKRQRDILDAFARMTKVGGMADAHLIIAGTGPLESELRAQVRATDIVPRVTFTGFLRDLRPLWAVADVALFASEAEGLCTALVEAQGAGLPAAISRAGGMPEVVEDGATGVIFNVGDVNALSAALNALRADAEKCKRMGRLAFQRAREKFSSEAMVQGIEKVYFDLVASGNYEKEE